MFKIDCRPFFALAVVGLMGVEACLAQSVDPSQTKSESPQTVSARAQTVPAQGAAGIGSASTISNRVEGFFGGDPRTLAVGSEIFQNELVRTALASDAKLIFLDNTNLSVGPASEVTLDRFVYDPDKSAGAVVVRTTKGIFRFVTGSQRPQDYLIATPIASIGVRGTIFDLLVMPDRVTVLLIEGQIQVTTLLNRTIALTQPGTSVTVFANGRVVGPSVWRGPVYVDFASTNFPYFPPMTGIKQKAVVPAVKKAKVEPQDPPRKRKKGPVVTERETEARPSIRVTGPLIRLGPRLGGDTRTYPMPPRGGSTPPSRSRPN